MRHVFDSFWSLLKLIEEFAQETKARFQEPGLLCDDTVICFEEEDPFDICPGIPVACDYYCNGNFLRREFFCF